MFGCTGGVESKILHCRIVAPVKVEKEAEKLYAVWRELPESEQGEWADYLLKNGSKAVKSYLRKCAEIHARLKPGEHV